MCFRLLDGTQFVVTLYHKHSRNNRTYFLDYATLAFGNYSTTEKDTGFKWIDGKTIYKKTYTGTITTGAASNSIITLETVSGLTGIISYSGFYYYGNISLYMTIPCANYQYGRYGYVDRTGNDIRLGTQSDVARTAAPYAVTVWYTK